MAAGTCSGWGDQLERWVFDCRTECQQCGGVGGWKAVQSVWVVDRSYRHSYLCWTRSDGGYMELASSEACCKACEEAVGRV